MFLAMWDCTQCAVVERVPGEVSGVWVFKTTPVPERALFENLEEGATVNDFLTWFPCVTHEQVEGVLEHAERSLPGPEHATGRVGMKIAFNQGTPAG